MPHQQNEEHHYTHPAAMRLHRPRSTAKTTSAPASAIPSQTGGVGMRSPGSWAACHATIVRDTCSSQPRWPPPNAIRGHSHKASRHCQPHERHHEYVRR